MSVFKLSKQEENQYSRHIMLKDFGLEGQLKIKKAKVFIYDMLDNESYKYAIKRNDENFKIDELIDYEEYCKASI